MLDLEQIFSIGMCLDSDTYPTVACHIDEMFDFEVANLYLSSHKVGVMVCAAHSDKMVGFASEETDQLMKERVQAFLADPIGHFESIDPEVAHSTDCLLLLMRAFPDAIPYVQERFPVLSEQLKFEISRIPKKFVPIPCSTCNKMIESEPKLGYRCRDCNKIVCPKCSKTKKEKLVTVLGTSYDEYRICKQCV